MLFRSNNKKKIDKLNAPINAKKKKSAVIEKKLRTKATKMDASASLLRKVNKKLDRIIELLEKREQ